MTEQELRALIRDAIAKAGVGGAARAATAAPYAPVSVRPTHSSHALFTLQGDPEGRCVIEPGVGCTHCGYCKSYGH